MNARRRFLSGLVAAPLAVAAEARSAPQAASQPAPDAPRPPALIPAGNLAGLPALAVPNGFGRQSLPTSLQLLGRAFSEGTLVALADRYQQVTEWHAKRPPWP